MSPEGRKDWIIEAVKEIILRGARIRPLVIAVEDLHWADKSTEDAFKWLLESIPAAKLLIIFTYRPEFVHTWGGRSYHNQITLNRLSNRESLLMVSHLLGTQAVDPELQSLILSKTEGVPFFIEEFVKSLQGLGVINREDGRVVLKEDPQSLAIPSTIQDMIMARVDRLSDEARGVLQAGSAIEREFSHDLIRAVTGLSEAELLSHLSAIKEAELLYERGIYPRSSYIFRHALTRDVVYGSMLARRSRELHGQIGTAIEELYKGDLADHYETLSEHFFRSEDYARAADYFKLAGKKAEKRASIPDAIAQAQKRVLCLEKLPEPAKAGKELVDARTVLGLYIAQINHLVEAKNAVEPVAQLAREKGYMRRLCQIQTVMGTYYQFIEEDFPKAVDAYEEALRIAGDENEIITLVLASYWLGLVRSFDCDFEKARSLIQTAVDINIAGKSLWGISVMKANLAYFCGFYPGRINDLTALSSEALNMARESGDTMSRGLSHTAYGAACYAKGNMVDAERNSLDGKLLCERIGMYSWVGIACGTLAETYFMMNEYQKSREFYDNLSVFFQRVQLYPSWVRWAHLGIVRCEIMLGKKDVNLESLRTIYERNRIRTAEGWICRFMGEVLLNLSDNHIAEAEQWIKKAIEADDRNSIRFHLGFDHALYGEFFKRRGNRTEAQDEFGKAIETLRECGADGWVEKYEKELAELS